MKLTETEVKSLGKTRNQLSRVCIILNSEIYYNNKGEAKVNKSMIRKIDLDIDSAIRVLDSTVCSKPEEI